MRLAGALQHWQHPHRDFDRWAFAALAFVQEQAVPFDYTATEATLCSFLTGQ